MNFDINTLSTLMQLMNSQKPRESDDASRAGNGGDNVYYNRPGTPSPSQSVFAMQNGLGQRVDIDSKPENKSQSTSNPMSAILDMMSGKGGSGSADMMSSLMPMFMNMMSKPAQVAGTNKPNADKGNQSFEQKLKSAMNNASADNSNRSEQVGNVDETKSANDSHCETVQNKQSNQIKSNFSRDKYSPISFAGYALVCSLNKLYMSKKYELL